MDYSKYRVVWNSQSENSAQSMPCGGYDCGALVWVENGQLLLYIDKSGSFDENNQMLKLGRFRFTFSQDIFSENFSQELVLPDGYVDITGNGAKIKVWFETDRSACHVDIKTDIPLTVCAIYENWRFEERELTPNERTAAASYVSYPGKVMTYPDTVVTEKDRVVFYHRNRSDKLLFDFLVEQQKLTEIRDELDNPQKNLAFGGMMSGGNCHFAGYTDGSYASVPYKGYVLESKTGCKHNFIMCFHNEQSESVNEYIRKLDSLAESCMNDTGSEQRAADWWRAYFERSYIDISGNESDSCYQITRNYLLFRYMLGCNAYGKYPTKFNGGLFISDPMYSVPDDKRGTNPDFRAWGGGSHTGQNQRLVYWNMLKSGDFDMMHPQFRYYSNMVKNAELRTRHYWGHDGCSFTEQLENMGLPIGWTWGYDETDDIHHLRTGVTDPHDLRSPWLTYYYATQLEFSYMILKYYRYTGMDISEYMHFIESSVKFYFEHYEKVYFELAREKYRDGKLVIYPSTALENYKGVLNPTEAVAGLRAVIGELTQLPEYADTEYYTKLLERVPQIPIDEKDGVRKIAPAEFYVAKTGDELPQLYPVFPYEFYGIGADDLETARNTWKNTSGSERNYVSWHQGGIFTARLGLAVEAMDYCIKKLSDGDQRFPAFWGPGHDWLPDFNWGGSGMIGLQEMLMQCRDEKIYLFPAWNKEHDAAFRLHAPYKTTVECVLHQGKIEKLQVTPESRMKDIVIL
ncbi:MAG: DUF5703 domain-containing protein [Eubacteriales bacterium]